MRYKHRRRSAFDEQMANDLMRHKMDSKIGRKLNNDPNPNETNQFGFL